MGASRRTCWRTRALRRGGRDSGELDPGPVRRAVVGKDPGSWPSPRRATSSAPGPMLPAITQKAHGFGALTYVDGVHHTARSDRCRRFGRRLLRYERLQVVWAPHRQADHRGPALLDTLHPDKLAPSPDSVPNRFERGTSPSLTSPGSRRRSSTWLPSTRRRAAGASGSWRRCPPSKRTRELSQEPLEGLGRDRQRRHLRRGSFSCAHGMLNVAGRKPAEVAEYLRGAPASMSGTATTTPGSWRECSRSAISGERCERVSCTTTTSPT